MGNSGEITYNTLITLRRVALGLAIGGSSGMLLGLAMGRWQWLRSLLDPLVAAAHPLPKIALLPLIIILFGIGEASKVVIVATVSFFPMLVNTMNGVDQIPDLFFEVARNYGVPSWKMPAVVLIPGSLPFALAGLRLATNTSLVVTIAVEIVASPTGLGELIWRAWETLRTEELYASLVVITALGILSNSAISGIRRVLVPWQAPSRQL